MKVLKYFNNHFLLIEPSKVMAIVFIEPSLFFTCHSHQASLIIKYSLKWHGSVRIVRISYLMIISKNICLQCGKNTSNLYGKLRDNKKRRSYNYFGMKSMGLMKSWLGTLDLQIIIIWKLLKISSCLLQVIEVSIMICKKLVLLAQNQKGTK